VPDERRLEPGDGRTLGAWLDPWFEDPSDIDSDAPRPICLNLTSISESDEPDSDYKEFDAFPHPEDDDAAQE